MSRKSVPAVYENGVFRPLGLVDLPEHQRVALVIDESPAISSEEDWLDVECIQLYADEADDSISLESVREALAKIPGSMTADFVAERDEE